VTRSRLTIDGAVDGEVDGTVLGRVDGASFHG
jgi:hypothetical protein